MLTLAGVESLVLVGQKKEAEVKLGGRPLRFAGFLLFARPSSPLSNSFFICSLEIGAWLTVSYGLY